MNPVHAERFSLQLHITVGSIFVKKSVHLTTIYAVRLFENRIHTLLNAIEIDLFLEVFNGMYNAFY